MVMYERHTMTMQEQQDARYAAGYFPPSIGQQ